MIEFENTVMNFIPEEISKALPHHLPIYLVGGAVRDAILGRRVVDLDFVLSNQVLKTARSLANILQGDFYVLDDERQIGRVIIENDKYRRQILDFALLRGSSLEDDLKQRDFTINAMALDVGNPTQLIDPLSGSRDLREKVLRVCSDSSIDDDPVRILRAIRMASTYQLRIHPHTLSLIRRGINRLNEVSAERIRDEIFRLLDTPGWATSLRALDMLGVIKIIFPELEGLKNIKVQGNQKKSKWEHTLEVIHHLENLLSVLAQLPDQDTGNNLMMGLVNLKIGRYRNPLNEHLETRFSSGRSARQALLLAATFHQVEDNNHFSDVDQKKRLITENRRINLISRLQTLCLSNQEVDRIIKINANYFSPLIPANPDQLPERREVYRFFNYCGEAGIDAGLLFLANTLAHGGLDLSPEVFEHQLSIVRSLYEAWWEKHEVLISPTLLINGDDLINIFKLTPGPLLGKILSELKEAQAIGEVTSREEALSFVKVLLKN